MAFCFDLIVAVLVVWWGLFEGNVERCMCVRDGFDIDIA